MAEKADKDVLLAAVDFSFYSEQALCFASQLAEKPNLGSVGKKTIARELNIRLHWAEAIWDEDTVNEIINHRL